VELVLEPMTPDDFDRRIADLSERYAGNIGTQRGMRPESARAEAARQIAELLPQGLHTETAILRVARVDGADVGWVWVTLPGVGGHDDMAWLHNIDVDPGHRGKGYGRAIMRAVEAELRRRDVDRLGLNVFGHNTTAIRLYESLGFQVTAQQMAKSLSS
jgi:ribosomal protein S18 acetylase RimI-like enzyme